jgi:hypothetical protein
MQVSLPSINKSTRFINGKPECPAKKFGGMLRTIAKSAVRCDGSHAFRPE